MPSPHSSTPTPSCSTLRSNLAPDAAIRGTEEVTILYRSSVTLYDGSPCTKHVTTNLIVEVDADRATASARSYFTVHQARPELPLQPIIAGRYHDCFARADGSWHFTDRLIFVDLVGDLRFHLKMPLPG